VPSHSVRLCCLEIGTVKYLFKINTSFERAFIPPLVTCLNLANKKFSAAGFGLLADWTTPESENLEEKIYLRDLV